VVNLAANRLEPWAVALAGFAVCLAVRVPSLGLHALWYDEILSAQTIHRDWLDLTVERLSARHSPLYFWILKALGLEGASDFLLRLPSAVLDSVAAALFAVTAWRVAGRVGAIVMIVLYAFGPSQIDLGQEARPYALLMAFVALAAFGYVGAIGALSEAEPRVAEPEGPRSTLRLAFILATIGTVGAGLTMVGGWVVALALQASIVVQSPEIRRRMVRPWLIHVVVTWLAVAPFAVAIFHPLQRAAGNYWAERSYPLSFDRLRELVDELLLFPGPVVGDVWTVVQLIANLALLLIALSALAAARKRPEVRLVGFVALAIPLLLVALSLVQSVLVGRYFVPALAFLGLLTSLGAARLWPRRGAPAVITVLCLVVVLQGIAAIVAGDKRDFRAVAGLLNRKASQAITMITSSPHRRLEIGYYLKPDVKFSVEGRPPDAVTAADIDRRIDEHGSLWLLYEEGDMPIVADRVPAGLVRCDWRHHEQAEWRLIVLARERGDLPRRLRSCRPDNGDL
jgi:mannosyltransferase